MHRVFAGPYGLRAGWRVVLYIVLVAIFSSAAGLVLRSGFSRMLDRDGERLAQTALSTLGFAWKRLTTSLTLACAEGCAALADGRTVAR